jgi:UDP-glucose 4-epimerase
MKVLVTGGAGFIGSHTVVELINSGYKPVIIDNFSNSEKSVLKNLKKITGQDIDCYTHDYADKDFLKKIIKKENIEGVIHFAAYKSVGESVEQPLKYYRNNVAGFINLLEVMQDCKVANLVFSSSCTVYGNADKLPITEKAPSKPAASPYGATKQICETVLKDVVSASDCVKAMALRYFNPIGAHESALIGELPKGTPMILVPYLTQTVAGWLGKLTVFGNDYPTPDGTCIRDYIHVTDLAKAHIKALEYISKKRAGFVDVCNVGTGKGTSVLQVINAFEKVTGKKVPYKIGARRAGDVVAAFADVKKAQETLGWKAQKTLDQALADAWRWQTTLKKPIKSTK